MRRAICHALTALRSRSLEHHRLADATHPQRHRENAQKREEPSAREHSPEYTNPRHRYIRAERSRRAFPMTDTELNVMAALARIGLSRIPKAGNNRPAAMGTPRTL